ncbi:MAG: helix-turn-helix domain-containing protein [Spirochaetaceae bacterium]|jgi:transcriptional regulator with XRE-family HTH domain|nr:helix-turn-helix domain-containing protein [Spirochaetaceae bacterium]
MTAGDRIRQVRKILDLKQSDFAKEVFVSASYITSLECGHKLANDRIIHLISTAFGVNPDWLKSGEGEMFQKTPAEKVERMTRLFNQLPLDFQECALAQLEKLADLAQDNS